MFYVYFFNQYFIVFVDLVGGSVLTRRHALDGFIGLNILDVLNQS